MNAVNVLSNNAEYFQQSSIATTGLRGILFAIAKGLMFIVDSVNKSLDQIYNLFGFSTYAPVLKFTKYFLPVVFGVFTIYLIYLGFKLMVKHDEVRIKNLGSQLLIFILVITATPMFIQSMTEFSLASTRYVKADFGDSKKIARNIMDTSVTDLLYMDKHNFNFNKSKKNGISADKITLIDITETVDPDDSIHSEVFSQKYTLNEKGKFKLIPMDSGGIFAKISPPYYYRYDVAWFTLFMGLISLGLTIMFSIYKVGRIVIEIAMHGFLAPLFAATDLESGQKTKEVYKSLMSLFMVIYIMAAILKFYFLFQSYLKIKLDQGVLNPFTYATLLLVAAFFVIDGPNLVERIIGVDAGIKSGYQFLIGSYAAFKTAGMVAKAPVKAGRMLKNGTGKDDKLNQSENTPKGIKSNKDSKGKEMGKEKGLSKDANAINKDNKGLKPGQGLNDKASKGVIGGIGNSKKSLDNDKVGGISDPSLSKSLKSQSNNKGSIYPDKNNKAGTSLKDKTGKDEQGKTSANAKDLSISGYNKGREQALKNNEGEKKNLKSEGALSGSENFKNKASDNHSKALGESTRKANASSSLGGNLNSLHSKNDAASLKNAAPLNQMQTAGSSPNVNGKGNTLHGAFFSPKLENVTTSKKGEEKVVTKGVIKKSSTAIKEKMKNKRKK